MDKKLFFSLVLVVLFVSGCATTSRQASTVGQLQVKVAQLEQQVQERDKEIEDLRFDIQDLQGQAGNLGEDNSSSVEEVSMGLKSSSDSIAEYATLNAEYVRVPVDAKQVQRALQKAGNYQGKIDGKIGSGSQKAIMDFQRDNNLKADGVVGKQTWALLKTHLE